jgi:hypothetical protein
LSDPILFEGSGTPFALGMTYFRDSLGSSAQQAGPRIYLEVFPEIWPSPVLAMVDTAAPWCIFDPAVGAKIRDRLDVVQENALLHTRLGYFQGTLGHGQLRIVAAQGEHLEVQALMFLSPDWPGGNFIGYEGCLDRIRFAVDPYRNRFYFASP